MRDCSGRKMTGPAPQVGYPDRAYPGCAEAMKQRFAARVPLAAVIVGEDDERVPREPVAVERFENAADSLVNSLNHANIIRARGLVPGLACAYVVRLIRRLDRRDHRVIRDIRKERLTRVTVNERDGGLCD